MGREVGAERTKQNRRERLDYLHTENGGEGDDRMKPNKRERCA